ncbi:MAG TPA: prepilin-type N-terminal cleavage/methylation domain-containing protein [Gemmatimonadales bacterium]|nr:prepilin-type N-terminal cleavage/methylation domain-containing protein [Gemmatimonadales bacterium]
MRDNRRGFTLVELLVALIMMVLVGGALYNMLLTVQRVSGRQTEVAGMNSNLRSGVQLIQNELSELGNNLTGTSGAVNDIVSFNSTSITYNALRGMGETCDLVSTTLVKVRQDSYSGVRIPSTRERLWLYFDKDSTATSDDRWETSAISSVASSVCADGTTPAWSLGVNFTSVTDAGTWYPIPVRTYERMVMGQVTDNGQNWLGIRSIDAGESALIPVIGPLASTGLNILYRDKDNNAAGSATDIKYIMFTLYGITDRTVSASGFNGAVGSVNDSLKVLVQLRNAK